MAQLINQLAIKLGIITKNGTPNTNDNENKAEETILDKLIVSPDRQKAMAQWLAENIYNAVDSSHYKALELGRTAFNPQLFKELEFFTSNDPEQQPHSYFDCLDRTQTLTGKYILRHILSHPSTHSKVLHERQQTITYLQQFDIEQDIQQRQFNGEDTKNSRGIPRTAAEIVAEQQDAVYRESAAMWFTNQLVHDGKYRSEELDELMSRLFFQHKWLRWVNEEDRLLNSYFLWKIFVAPFRVALQPLAVLLVVWYVMLLLLRRVNPDLRFKDIAPMFWKYVKHSFLGSQFFTLMRTLKDYLATPACWGSPDASPLTKIKLMLTTGILAVLCSPVGTHGYLGLVIYGFCSSIYQSIQASLDYLHTFNYLDNKIAGLREMITRCQTFSETHYPKMQHISSEFCKIHSLFNDALTKSDAIRYLISDGHRVGCRRHHMPGPGKRCLDLCWSPGRIMKAFYLLARQPDTNMSGNLSTLEALGNIMTFHGWIDCYEATKRLVSAGGLCQAQYMNNTTLPELHIKGVYHPLNGSQSVTNDLDLESVTKADNTHISTDVIDTDDNNVVDKPRNMILSGPNGSGKSTYLKAVMSAVICAQTLGYVPARQCLLSPFRYLSTYMNIPDCQGRESLFQAEMNRCYKHLQILKDIEARKVPSFNIMDEIFSSTNYQEGVAGAYAVLRRIGQMQHALNIITTHYDQLTNLGPEDQPAGFCYKHFTAHLDSLDDDISVDGTGGLNKATWRCDYKLRDGVNKKHLALHLLQQRGFDNELIQDAVGMYERVCGHPNLVIEEELRDLGIVVDADGPDVIDDNGEHKDANDDEHNVDVHNTDG